MRRARWCVGVSVVVMFAVGIGPIALATRADAADAAAEWQFVDRVNQLRADLGLAPLLTDARLTEVARQWSVTMINADRLFHDMALPRQVDGWVKLGENVGVGLSVDALVDAFEASPPHLEHLVDPAYTLVGIGVVEARGQLWVTEEFERPGAAPARAVVRLAASAAVATPTHGRVWADSAPQRVMSPVARALDLVRAWATRVADAIGQKRNN